MLVTLEKQWEVGHIYGMKSRDPAYTLGKVHFGSPSYNNFTPFVI